MTKQLVVGDTAQPTTDTNTENTDTNSDADTDTTTWRSHVVDWVRHHTPTIGLQQQCPHCHGDGEITTERERRLNELSTQQMRFLQQAYLERWAIVRANTAQSVGAERELAESNRTPGVRIDTPVLTAFCRTVSLAVVYTTHRRLFTITVSVSVTHTISYGTHR